MIKKIIQNNKGLMLIELIITLSLLVIVLSLGFMYFQFGTQAYSRGEEKAIAQEAARWSSDFITRELRYAEVIIIDPEEGILSNDDYNYIYQDDNNSIVYLGEDSTEKVLASNKKDGIDYSITFTQKEKSNGEVYDDLITFTIKADENLYELSTTVHAVNLKLRGSEEQIIIGEGNYNGSIVKYEKPDITTGD